MDEAQSAFRVLKEKLTTISILKRPELDQPFILYTDIYTSRLGAILFQKQDGKEVIIAYVSYKTNPVQRNYGATQLELLVVIWALKHFRYYLIGRRFTLTTDHQALKWLINIDNPSGIYAR